MIPVNPTCERPVMNWLQKWTLNTQSMKERATIVVWSIVISIATTEHVTSHILSILKPPLVQKTLQYSIRWVKAWKLKCETLLVLTHALYLQIYLPWTLSVVRSASYPCSTLINGEIYRTFALYHPWRRCQRMWGPSGTQIDFYITNSHIAPVILSKRQLPPFWLKSR